MARTGCDICGREVDADEIDPCGHFALDDDGEDCPVAGCDAKLVEFGSVSGGSEQATKGTLDCAVCARGHNVFSRGGSPWDPDTD
jgi:hypothetical protein